MSWSGPQLTRVIMFATLLLAIILMRRPCADAVGRFVSSFDETPAGHDGGVRAVPKPEAIVDDTAAPAHDPYKTDYVEIKPGMTDAEIQAAIEKARAKAEQGALDAGAAPAPTPPPSPTPSGAP
jgi:hypothetical protein